MTYVNAIQYTNAKQMIAAAHNLHNRLMSPRRATQKVVEAKPIKEEKIAAVETVKTRKSGAFKGTAKEYVVNRCEEIGVDFFDVIGPRRNRAIVELRDMLIMETVNRFPLQSLVMIGLLFSRDHTSILASLDRTRLKLELAEKGIDKKALIKKSGVSGVLWDARCNAWNVRFRFNGARHYFGQYTNIDDAIEMRVKAEKALRMNQLDSILRKD